MKFSHSWLQTFFSEPLPAANEVADLLTTHSSEIEAIIPVGDDTVLDVRVLPDKSAWLLSHRGLAKEIATIISRPLSHDPLAGASPTLQQDSSLVLTLETDTCDYYSAAVIDQVKVGPSPDWLRQRLEAIGQRSINNIVDATNYVMFELGQPLHAFAADKLTYQDGTYALGVRSATAGELITTLTGDECTLTVSDAVVIDTVTNLPIAIAGVKGGNRAAVTADTTRIVVESAHFARVPVRRTAKRLRLPTDAAKRYENGIVAGVAPIALRQVVALITNIAGGSVLAESSVGTLIRVESPVSVSFSAINSVLGLKLTENEVSGILDQFGYTYTIEEERVTVLPPFEREDLTLAEDVIEEIGRLYGLDKIESIKPKPATVSEYNTRHYYAEKIRTALVAIGFSEIYTSSFRAKDTVALENALASDKGYLRSSLVANITEARAANSAHRDILGLSAVQLFEIGTVFLPEAEEFRVAIAVQVGSTYKEKTAAPLLKHAEEALVSALGRLPEFLTNKDGVIEFSLDKILTDLPAATSYDTAVIKSAITYQSFSVYPSISRDVAFWVPDEVPDEAVQSVLESASGSLRKRTMFLDRFVKEGKTSLAFRLVFQANDRTLTDIEVEGLMSTVYAAITQAGWEPR